MPYAMLTELPAPPPDKEGWPWIVETLPEQGEVGNGRSSPRITVVTPSYNQGQFIEATIRSVLLQSYPNLEYIIMDGGSQDGTVDIIRRYESWLTQWVSEPDRGQSHAINKGLNQGTGQIFTWLNSDDMLLPGALWRVAEAYRAAPDAAAWVGSCHLIRPDGRIIKTVIPRGLDRDSLADWYYGGFIFQPSCFFAANAWQEIDGVDESLYFAMDFDLWLRLSAIGEFKPMPQILAAAIIHDSAKTQALIPEMHAETMVVQFKYGYRDLAYKRQRRLLDSTIKNQQKGRKLQARAKRAMRRLRAIGNKETPHVQYVQFAATNSTLNQTEGS